MIWLSSFGYHTHADVLILVPSQPIAEQHDEDMEQILIAHMRVNDSQGALDKRICHMLSKACLGIRTIKKPKDPRVYCQLFHWTCLLFKTLFKKSSQNLTLLSLVAFFDCLFIGLLVLLTKNDSLIKLRC